MNNLNKEGGSSIATNSILRRKEIDDKVNVESTFHSRMVNALLQDDAQNEYDVTFIVGNEKIEIGAHKMILQMQSPKLRDLFQNDKDAYDIIAEDSVTPEEFRLFLQFLYTGILADNIKSVLPIFQLAGKYDIPDLQNICCNQWLEEFEELELKSVVLMHEQAVKYGQDEFARQCFIIMTGYGSEVLNSTEVLQFTNENLCKLINSDFLNVYDEIEVLQAVLRWGKNQCEAKGKQLSGENLRIELEDLIPLIRFPLMDKSDFASEVIPTEILTDKEIISVLSYYNTYTDLIAPKIFLSTPRKPIGWFEIKTTLLLKELGTFHERMLHELFDGNQNSYDVTFIVGSKNIEVGAHRTILQIQAPKLYGVFDKSLKAYNVEDDCTPAEFRMFLQFLYTGVLTDDDRVYALPLLKLAIKYDIPDLRKACNRLLEENFDLQSAVQMYDKACQYGEPDLKQKYLDLICRNGSKVLDSTEFLNFTNQTLCTVIASDNLICSKEIEVFKAIVRWGKKQCVENGKNPSGANLRNELNDLIPLIRFRLINKKEFSQQVLPLHILNDKEIISILLYDNAEECKRNQIAPEIFSTTPGKESKSNNAGSKIEKANDENLSISDIIVIVLLLLVILAFVINVLHL